MKRAFYISIRFSALQQGVLYQLYFYINPNWTLNPALAPAVSWPSNYQTTSLKRTESVKSWKKHWLIPYSHQNVSCHKNDVGHPQFTDNNIAEKWLTPLLKQVKFWCVNLGESKGAQILLIIWISWSGSEGERIGQLWRIMGPLMDIKVFSTNLIRVVLISNHINEWHHDEIVLRSFISSLFFVFYSFTPEIQMKGAFFLFFGNLHQAFPFKTIFWWSSWLKYPINCCIYKLKCEKGILYFNPLQCFATLAHPWTVTSWHHCKRILGSALWNLWSVFTALAQLRRS